MVRTVTEADIGLRVLYPLSGTDSPSHPTSTIAVDIVALHGIGAHPDHTWTKNVGSNEAPRWVNWLSDAAMLPAVVPTARIMRYGYESAWFGPDAIRQSVSEVALRLLRSLKRQRKNCVDRPLLFIAHCFGGLVVLKALLEAKHEEDEWPGIFTCTTGLAFFGTPFRGAEGLSQAELLAAARREYLEEEIQGEVLEVLRPGNEFLRDVVDTFCKTQSRRGKTQVACFYEMKASNVGAIVGKQARTTFVVSKDSGCLDLTESTKKYSLARNHFNMNKFGTMDEEDCQTVCEAIRSMASEAANVITIRTRRQVPASDAPRPPDDHPLARFSKPNVVPMHTSRRLPPNFPILDLRKSTLSSFVASFRHQDYQEDLENLQQHHSLGTCEWFLDTEHFKWWCERPQPVALCFTGALGLGKSTLLAHVLYELKERHSKTPYNGFHGVCYSFCKEQRDYTASMILSSAIHQLLVQFPEAQSPLYDYDSGNTPRGIYRRLEGKTRSAHILWNLLLQVVKFAKLSRLYLVIDAVDECDPRQQDTIFRQIFNAMEGRLSIKVLLSSRPRTLIVHDFGKLSARRPNNFRLCVAENHDDAIRADIKGLVTERIERFCNERDLTTEQCSQLIAKWTSTGPSLFLPAALFLQQLENTPANEIEISLSELPRSLRVQYEDLMSQPQNDTATLQRHTFTFLAYCFKRLSVHDISYLHSCMDAKNPEMRYSGLDTLKPVERRHLAKQIRRLSPLLKIDSQGFVDFVHLSVKEYLCLQVAHEKGFVLSEEEANRFLSTVCLHTLVNNHIRDFPHFSHDARRRDALTKNLIDEPLFMYAVRTWSKHLKVATDGLGVSQPLDKELEVSAMAFFKTWFRDHPSFQLFVLSEAHKQGITQEQNDISVSGDLRLFQLLCEFGLVYFLRRFLDEHKTSIPQLARGAQLALRTAIRNGHVQVVDLLIERFSITSLDENIHSDIIAQAAWSQNPSLLRAILALRKHRLDELTDAMLAAYTTGQRETLDELIKDGTVFQERDHSSRTALHSIVLKYFTTGERFIDPRTILAIAIFLIDNGVEINAVDKFGFTALHYVCWCTDLCNRDIIAGLYHWGADLYARTNGGLTALHFAAAFADNPEAIHFLLEKTNNDLICARSKGGNTPLHWAASLRRADEHARSFASSSYILKFMIQCGADPYTRNRWNSKPCDRPFWEQIMIETYNRVNSDDRQLVSFDELRKAEQEIASARCEGGRVRPNDRLLAELRSIQRLRNQQRVVDFRLPPYDRRVEEADGEVEELDRKATEIPRKVRESFAHEGEAMSDEDDDEMFNEDEEGMSEEVQETHAFPSHNEHKTSPAGSSQANGEGDIESLARPDLALDRHERHVHTLPILEEIRLWLWERL